MAKTPKTNDMRARAVLLFNSAGELVYCKMLLRDTDPAEIIEYGGSSYICDSIEYTTNENEGVIFSYTIAKTIEQL